MKKVAYVIPYFGKFPKGFDLFLMSCRNNPTIDWLIFTDDHTSYEYPSNVKVYYCPNFSPGCIRIYDRPYHGG